jgi:hypothetical protein
VIALIKGLFRDCGTKVVMASFEVTLAFKGAIGGSE